VKRRRLFIIISASIAAVILGFVVWPREREPEYNGIPLSTWLERGGRNYYDTQFITAIKHTGTNGLPILVRSVDYRISRWRLWFADKIGPKLPIAVMNKGPVQWLLDEPALRRAHAAVVAFEILGPDASPALDDLKRIANKSDPSSFAGRALFAMTASKPGDFDPF
jgi:hypothetical protein